LLRYLKEKQQYLVEPRLFRRHIFDAPWFIWLFGIMELLEALHELNVLSISSVDQGILRVSGP